MKKIMFSKDHYYSKTRDRIGGTIRTDVYKKEDGLFQAFSYYWQDEDEKIVGYAESYDDARAVMLSRRDLRKEWKEYLERKNNGIEENSSFTIYMSNGEIIKS